MSHLRSVPVAHYSITVDEMPRRIAEEPEDLAPLLLDGATVVRREGRLFATVAVTSDDGLEPGSASAQVDRLTDAGFKVEWTTRSPLGV